MRSPQKILLFITELDTGGAQNALARLLARLDQHRFSPSVACLYNGDKIVAQEIRALDIPVTDLGMTAKWRWDALWRFYHLLRRHRPTILHTWMFHANIPGRVLGRLAGVPIIISSERTMGQEGHIRRWSNRLTAPLADQVTCVSKSVADYAARVIRIRRDKLFVIPNGISLEDFPPADPAGARATLGLSADTLVVGTVGRLQPVKGTRYLLEAFARLAAEHADVILLLVGDGRERASLQSLAQQLGIAKIVRFLGDRPDVSRWLHTMDVFVLPSIWEGMPNAVLEAMAVGLPVAATAVGGTSEVVVDGVTGLLVPPRDPDALAGAVTRLLRDSDLRRTMGQAGRVRVEQHFSIEETVRQTEGLYTNLLKEKGY